jgi:hypothetical protein
MNVIDTHNRLIGPEIINFPARDKQVRRDGIVERDGRRLLVPEIAMPPGESPTSKRKRASHTWIADSSQRKPY